MFDSLTIARQLTDAGIDRGHADALADAIRQAAEHGEHVYPDGQDRFSICIAPNCLDAVVAHIGVTVIVRQPGALYVDLMCRGDFSGRDHLIAGGFGEEHIFIAGQIAPQFWRWCNVIVENYESYQQTYQVNVLAQPETDPPTQLWPGRKRSGRIP